MTPSQLPERWREQAETLAAFGDARGAAVVRRLADELVAALAEQADAPLDLVTAARESGYSRDRLRHMIADGVLPNAGSKGRPRVRRADLPRKPRPALGGFDPVERLRGRPR